MTLTTSEFSQLFRRLVESAGIFNLRPTENDHVFTEIAERFTDGSRGISAYLNFETAWSVSVTVEVRITLASESPRLNRSREAHVVATTKCSLNWSATGRGLPNATAAIALYGKALALAAQIEATFGDVTMSGLDPLNYPAE